MAADAFGQQPRLTPLDLCAHGVPQAPHLPLLPASLLLDPAAATGAQTKAPGTDDTPTGGEHWAGPACLGPLGTGSWLLVLPNLCSAA